MCNPKPPGLRPELLSTSQVSLSNDTLAVVEGAAATSVRFYDTAQGRPLGEAYQHTCAVQQIALSQVGGRWKQGGLPACSVLFCASVHRTYVLVCSMAPCAAPTLPLGLHAWQAVLQRQSCRGSLAEAVLQSMFLDLMSPSVL